MGFSFVADAAANLDEPFGRIPQTFSCLAELIFRQESGKSPPKLGGDPSRSEGGSAGSASRASALLMDFREALLFLPVRYANVYKELASRIR